MFFSKKGSQQTRRIAISCFAVTLAFGLKAAAADGYEVARRSVTNTYEDAGGALQTQTTHTYYGENGLVTGMEVEHDGERGGVTTSYTFDDAGNVTEAFLDAGAEGNFQIILENTYDGARLQKVVVTNVLTDGEEALTEGTFDDPTGVPMATVSAINAAVGCIEHFTGYEDTSLYVKGWEFPVREYAGRKLIRSGLLVPGQWQVTEHITHEDGSLEDGTSISMWQAGAWKWINTQTTVQDAQNKITEIKMSSEEQTADRILAYREEVSEATGQTVLRGYEEGSTDLEYGNTPLTEYTLDETGHVVSGQVFTAGVTYTYDVLGRILTQEVQPGGETRIYTEYEYRN